MGAQPRTGEEGGRREGRGALGAGVFGAGGEKMCPACMATMAVIFGSAVSGGGVAALVVKKWRAKNAAQEAPEKVNAKENEHGKRED